MVQENLVLIGFLVIVIGMILIVIGSLASSKETKTYFGVGGFIGFLPFGFANSKEMLYLAVGLSVTIFIIFLLFGSRTATP